MVLIAPRNWWAPLEAPYKSSVSHKSDINIISGSYASKFEEFPLGDNVGGVSGQNCIPHLVKPSTNLYLGSKFWHMSMVKP